MDTKDNLEAAFGPRRSVISALMTVALLGVMLDCFQPANAGVRSRISDPTASRGNSHPAQTGKKASTSDNADEAFLAQVSARILAVARKHPANVSWPPAITLVDAGDLNAYANLEVDRLDDGKFKERTDRNGKFIPYVAVDRLMMEEVIQGNPDRLAMLVAHELGVREIWEVFNSESFSRKYPHSEYSSFEAAGEDHPSWSDRLSYIDKEKANVWKAMSAFENGAIFLQIQQYPSAAESFSRVIQEFPDNYEAWVNLGYARLMMYLDAFDPNTLKRYDIGQVVVGSFYLRPEELRSRSRGDNAFITITWERYSLMLPWRISRMTKSASLRGDSRKRENSSRVSRSCPAPSTTIWHWLPSVQTVVSRSAPLRRISDAGRPHLYC